MRSASQMPTIRLHARDNVVVARVALEPGSAVPEEALTCRDPVPPGHKVATAGIARGAAVRKYDQIIGFATRDIEPGQHVHTHNLAVGAFEREHDFGAEARPTPLVPEARRARFQGIVRPDGRVATRNYVGVLPTVNCSATVARAIAAAFEGDALAPFPNVDGVVALPHGEGCATAGRGENFERLQRTFAGWIRHPNFAAVILVGLGCEANEAGLLMSCMGFQAGPFTHVMNIQEHGGTGATVAEAVGRIGRMLPDVNRIERRPVSAEHLILALECGGSDAHSGITANPVLGAAADLLVRHGGTAVLSETPEIYGAEHLLTRRAASREVGEALVRRIRWWEEHTARLDGEMDNNPTQGNKAGGLTTILEKSLGAVAKGGTTRLMAVYEYAETIRGRGLVFMDTPGYDPVSVTGMVAGGANVIGFTTGRGSAFGCKPVPSIKLASNTALYERMTGDMDVNCGVILDGTSSVEELGEAVFRLILDVASGRRTKSEIQGYGDLEFIPWRTGAQM